MQGWIHSTCAPFLQGFRGSNPVLLVAVFVFLGLSIGCEPTVSDPYQPISPTRPQTPGVPFFKANAGEDLVVYVPNVMVQLDANLSEDTGRIITSYTWEKLVNGLLVGPIMKGLRVNTILEEEGIHLFKLTATSRYGTTSFDTVKVTVIDNFAIGIPPTFENACDTLYTYNQQIVYFLDANAFVDSSGIRYYLPGKYTFTQLSGPSPAKITPNPNQSKAAIVENITTGNYSFKVEVERKNMKVYDTLVLALLPDTVIGKTYIFESSWKTDPNFSMSGVFAMAEVQNLQAFLLNFSGRVIRLWIAEEGNTGWTEVSNEWFSDLYWYPLQCGNGLQVVRLTEDKSIIGKKLRVRISIIT